MQFGICPLSIVSVRSSADDTSEMVSQVLYGEHFKVLECRKFWSKIRIAFDGCEGWMSNHQIKFIEQDIFNTLEKAKNPLYSNDLVSFVETEESILLPILLGSSSQNASLLSHKFDGNHLPRNSKKANLVQTALLFLNAPYLWGGKTPFGIDASGFTQMVYKINGCRLLRKVQEQSEQGSPLSFIEESEAGDLVFFDNNEGEIHHVGLIMDNNYVIHVDGKVRIDRLDHTGIFNAEDGKYTYQLRVIKKLI
ncbi:SH3 domain-containing protein [Pricia antarctica]|uniref:SH3 domain-containing protein n=1 Tax=Pricia antarctica TaxID=641691 RepID=A0A1G7FWJ5_9FLAO|nr:C40 family peptidase [Pricia antarctica]SDE80249.1 SH3 domain-containing protein [Pricia antarctica]